MSDVSRWPELTPVSVPPFSGNPWLSQSHPRTARPPALSAQRATRWRRFLPLTIQIGKYSFSRLRGTFASAAKSVNVVPETNIGVAGILVITVPGATVLGRGAPTTASNDFRFARFRTSGILFWRAAVVIDLIKIVAPLPQIPTHVVQVPSVRLLLSDWPRMPTGIFIKPGKVSQTSRGLT